MKTLAGLLTLICAVAVATAATQANRNEQELKKKIDIATENLRNLEQATLADMVRNGKYPETLEQLTKPDSKGRPATLEVSVLTDPWGRLYRYEPDKRHLKTDKPLIYTQGPDPTDRNSKITNWDAFDKKK